MDRSLWSTSFSKHSCPRWPCRHCSTGHLALQPETLKFEETEASKSQHSYEEWDPEWIDYAFTLWAKCSNPSCNQQYAISGVGGVEQQYTDQDDWDWEEYFVPKIIYPMPDIFTLPKKCPEEIAISTREAFSLYLFDNNSCAGKLRVTLEMLMDFLNIPSEKTSGEGNTTRIKLHDRIDIYEQHEPKIAKHLMAVKWLGNTAVHENITIPRGDLLDAFEIIEHALSEIIEKRTARVEELASKLNKKHKPQKP